jgi:hypothetical protein
LKAHACALALLVAGCSPDTLTEVVVITSTDLRVPADIDGVRFTVDSSQAGGDVAEREVPLDGPEAVALPLRLPIVMRGSSLGPLIVTVSGLKGARLVIERQVRFDFVRGASYEIGIDLTRDCLDVSCARDETCEAGRCRPTAIGRPIPDAGVRDAGRDAGAPDAGSDGGSPPDDAGMPGCPLSCGLCDATCALGCRCRRACECTLSCPPFARCHDVRCEEDASCVVHGSDEVDLEVECRDGSTCEVYCGSAARCRARCKPGADCILHCEDARDCSFAECGSGSSGGDGDDLHCEP